MDKSAYAWGTYHGDNGDTLWGQSLALGTVACALGQSLALWGQMGRI
jgi:hypothetical protein